ncbi:MAG TPA: TlpA disulfide reductase family protein [Sandaracinaceae bacterium]
MSNAIRRGVRSIGPWLLLLGAIVLWVTFDGGRAEVLPAGTPAPPLRVPWTDGGELDLSARRGRVTVLAFWATWCPACRREGPMLSRVHERIAPRGDAVVGVSVDRAPLGSVARAARSLGMTYPIALATRADIDRYRIELLPSLVVIGPDGRVAASFAGGAGEDELLEAVERAR